MLAVRNAANKEGTIQLRDVLLALAWGTSPGESSIGTALRDSTIWRQLPNTLAGMAGANPGMGFQIFQLEISTEEAARTEGARTVGERHLVAAMGPQAWNAAQVDVTRLTEAVRLAELGPDLAQETLAGRWHGLLDANIIIQYKPLEDIDWFRETESAAVSLWIPYSLLRELDELKFMGGSRRVRERAGWFTKWLDARMDQCLARGGLQLRSGTNLKVWPGAPTTGMRDTDHMEAALALRALGVGMSIVTADTGLRARARVNGFDVLTPGDQWQLPPEPTPREREMQERLRQAALELPPQLSLASDRDVSFWIVKLVSAADGGEAREVRINWKCHGGFDEVREVATNEALRTDANGQFRQQVLGPLPPGISLDLAHLTAKLPPFAITYAITSARGYSIKGQLKWDDRRGYVHAVEGEHFPAERHAEH